MAAAPTSNDAILAAALAAHAAAVAAHDAAPTLANRHRLVEQMFGKKMGAK